MEKISRLKKAILLIGVSVLACFALVGCRGPKYTQEEYDAAEKKGRAVMEEWMDEYYLQGEIVSISPYVYMYPKLCVCNQI